MDWGNLKDSLKTFVLSMLTMEQKNLWYQAQAHTVEAFVPVEHRDTASSKANKFNFTIDEENIDFTISGVSNAMVKRSHEINVHNLIQIIEIPPSSTCTSKWSSTTSTIQPFLLKKKNTKCDQSCWKQWTMRDSRCGARSTMQSMSDVLGRWHRLLHVRAPLKKWHKRKQEVYFPRSWSLLYPELLHQERPTTRLQVREERRLQRIRPHGKSTSKEVSKETTQEHSRSISRWSMVQKDYDRIGSLWRSNLWDGQIGERRLHPYCHRRKTWCISWQLVDRFELCRFRHDAGETSTWLQENAVYIASPQESGE